MSVSLKRRPKRETVRQGPAAVFNWGAPLQQKSMAEIAAMEPAEWETTATRAVDRHGLPPSLGLRRVDMVGVAVVENVNALRHERDRLGAHTVAMALRPVAARIAALLDEAVAR